MVTHAALPPCIDARIADRRQVATSATRRRRERLQPLRLPEHQHASGAAQRHGDLDIPRAHPRRLQEFHAVTTQATARRQNQHCHLRRRLPHGVLRQYQARDCTRECLYKEIEDEVARIHVVHLDSESKSEADFKLFMMPIAAM